jgi:Tol biopolymer transport system component
MNADGSGQRNLTREVGLSVDGFPVWSPNWRQIAFENDPCPARPGACDRNSAIYRIAADGSRLTRLARGVRAMSISNGQGITAGHTVPAWSPDGRAIAFVSDRHGDFEVYVMNTDGSRQRNLTRSPAFDDFGAAGRGRSPAGTRPSGRPMGRGSRSEATATATARCTS